MGFGAWYAYKVLVFEVQNMIVSRHVSMFVDDTNYILKEKNS